MWNNGFNLAMLEAFNQYASGHAAANLNRAVHFIQGAFMFKGFPVMGLLWYFWFRDDGPARRGRKIVVATFIGCLLALFLARLINNVAPFQPRPIANAVLALQPLTALPVMQGFEVRDVNSFPSDHAAMFFSLAMGMFFISRGIGLLALAYVSVFIALPRIYLGLHYPTDIVVGAMMGMASTALMLEQNVHRLYAEPSMRLIDRYPAAAQTALLLLTFEIAVMFTDVRNFMKGLANTFS